MHKHYRLAAGLLFLGMMPVLVARAAQEYTYTVTVYAGNHGSFDNTDMVSVAKEGSDADIRLDKDGSAIRVSGLKKGDMVLFDAALDGAVHLEEHSRYYVKGVRRSGRDNSAVDHSGFQADADREYVVAYGIRGDMTSYTVNYQDSAGRALAPSRVYYGNVGDSPVAAFLYVPGYMPKVWNLTKKLEKNEAENVFTFVYSKAALPSGGSNTGDSGSGILGGGAAGGEALGEAGSREAAAEEAYTEKDKPALLSHPAAESDAGTASLQDAVPEAEDPADKHAQENGQEFLELDDPEVPGAGMDEDEEGDKDRTEGSLLFTAVLAAIAAVLALLFLILSRLGEYLPGNRKGR